VIFNTVCVLGMGYIGLPLASSFATHGVRVVGMDVNPQIINTLRNGALHIHEPGLRALVQEALQSGNLLIRQEVEAADAFIIAVPTPFYADKRADLSFVQSAAESIVPHLRQGNLVVLESTSPPQTTTHVVAPILERTGLKAGKDFFLAFSPERVDPGRKDWTTYNTPKVVGGITPACCKVAATWYAQALKEVVPVSTAEVAEMAKLLENTFRMINLGLVNELAIMCDRLGVDVWEVIEAAATKPFGFMKFTPGPGIGGHCIPIDPLYLSWKLRSLNYTARFIELASEINAGMPRFAVGRVQDALNDRGKPLKGSRVLVLGVAYKPDIDDLRESPALDVIRLMQDKGAQVVYHDPYIPHFDHDGWKMDSVADLMAEVKLADCVVIVTNHKVYDYPAVLKAARLVVDTRNALGQLGKDNPKVKRL